MRRVAKLDANQQQVVEALRKAGATVQSLAAIGKGCPDVLAATADGRMYLFEIKNRKGKNDLKNAAQAKWHIEWNAPVYVVHEPHEALAAIGVS